MPDAGAADAHGSPDPADPRWTQDVVLADGSTARVRPIRPDDGPALLDFHGRQSRESIYFRFFSPRPHLSDEDVAKLTTVDGFERMAFVAERDGALVGIARFDRYPGQRTAEAAFFTDDELKGRGIATLLLEYLAAYGREAGITQFDAHVLPENRRMARVFRQAGYNVASTFADGVIEVTLDIEPSPGAVAAMEDRAHRAERQSVVRLLEPRTIAVIGAGRTPGGIGHRVLQNLLAGPFEGPVYVVHPSARSVAGVRAYPTVGDIPDDVDVAVVTVPAVDVADVVEACGRARVGAAVVISAGFAETGPDGAASQRRLVAIARRYGMRILGPNCLGVINTDAAIRMRATFTDAAVRPGRVALLSQAGTLGAVILELADRMGLGISTFVAVGNKADLSGNDLLQYWLDDERTDVVLLYLESFGNPRRFQRNVRQVAARKPVFAVRSGAAFDVGGDGADFDGWLDDSTIDALLRQTGVVRVPTVKALLDAALVASTQPRPTGSGIVVVGNSGGSVAMAADSCLTAGLSLADLGPDTLRLVDDLRLHGRRAANPVELSYDASAEDYETVLRAVMADDAVDLVLVVHAPYDRTDVTAAEAVLDRVAVDHPGTPLVACVYGPHSEHTVAGVPIFDFPDDAAFALGNVVRHAMWQAAQGAGTMPALEDVDAVTRLVAGWLGDGSRQRLDPVQARQLLSAAGVAVVPVQLLDDPDDLDGVEVTAPVAVKADAHRAGAATRASGVALDLDDGPAVRAAVEQIVGSLGAEAWPMVLQPMVTPGTDVAVSIRTHPVVGPVLAVGPGGGAGAFAVPARRVLPVTDEQAAALVSESGLEEALDGEARSRLGRFCARLAALVEAAPEIVELVCDPVIVRSDGVDVIEVRVQLAPVQGAEPPDVRRI